jgi:AraC family transcriptional regulator, regulatory protein of adaptative response / methylated-DNA-[protein]-cysteine methyltransferase
MIMPLNRKETSFTNDADRWKALVSRDPDAEGAFFYGVVTTGVFCRPTCFSRIPNRKNVVFFATAKKAGQAGFRPCKRCEPDRAPLQQLHAKAVIRACQLLDEAQKPPPLKELASHVGISPYHFNRIFKRITGVTPKEYGAAKRTQRLIKSLGKGRSVTQAIYDAGYGSPSRFYEHGASVLGAAPSRYKTGGAGLEIRYALNETSLGWLLMAATKRGVCAIEFGETPEQLTGRLRERFPNADLEKGGPGFDEWVGSVVSCVEAPRLSLSLPLDIRGTAFQQKVWKALRAIPSGSTASYGEIARRLGVPKAARAVARACASNPVAVAVPCHRAVRGDGGLGGYRWGLRRKRALLDRECIGMGLNHTNKSD